MMRVDSHIEAARWSLTRELGVAPVGIGKRIDTRWVNHVGPSIFAVQKSVDTVKAHH